MRSIEISSLRVYDLMNAYIGLVLGPCLVMSG